MAPTITPPAITPWPYGGCGNAGIDWIATDQLGPIQYVSGMRIARGLGAGRDYNGHLYTANEPGTDRIERVWPDRVVFTIAPYETTRTARRSHGPARSVVISTVGERVDGSTYQRSDYELWNLAASHLRAASDTLTLRIHSQRPVAGPWHFMQGRWKVRLATIDGYDPTETIASWQRIPRGYFNQRSFHHRLDQVHWLACDKQGNEIRLSYEKVGDANGYEYQLRFSQPINTGRDVDKLPKYLTNWIESRCF